MSRHKVFYYDIHNIIGIRSTQKLPELDYFKIEEPLENVDIDVKIAGNVLASKQDNSICYKEILGNWGFSIVINRSEAKTEVLASQLIGMSPHVLYTNVVEPLLRWLFVRKGYALMHGACIAFNGQALFITAQTDTGKTTTILHTVRDNLATCQFLSDDMTIFSKDGQVLSYPKPLTISQHTLQAMGGAPLTLKQRFFLQLQSRLHSRQGRGVGMWLSDIKAPAATLSAIVQKIIPPPKYTIDTLIPGANYANTAKLAQIVLIERGNDFEGEIANEDKINILLANADDAYGFPPYPVLAKEISSWNGQDLHEVEKEIVRLAIENLPTKHLRSSNYNWHKRLPSLINDL